MSSQPGPTPRFDALLKRVQALLYEDAEVRDVPRDIIEDILPTALEEFSEWYPLRLQANIPIVSGTLQYALPSGFKEVDPDSFNEAVNPSSLSYSYSGYSFELGHTQARATNAMTSGIPSFPGLDQLLIRPPFESGTKFDFLDDGNGGKVMAITPKPAQTIEIRFVYLAAHTIGLKNDAEGQDEIFTPASTDVYVLALKLCEHACRALSRQMMDDKFMMKNLMGLAKDFRTQFTERTRSKGFIVA